MDEEKIFNISKTFYHRIKDTITKWEALDQTLIGNVAPEAKDLLVIDGDDLKAIKVALGNPLASSPLKLFTFSETGYANGMVTAWQYALQLAESEEPLTADHIIELHRIIGDSELEDLSFRNEEVKSFADLHNLTPEGLEEIKDFALGLQGLKPTQGDVPELHFHTRTDPATRIQSPSHEMAMEDGLYLVNAETTPEKLKIVVDKLLGVYQRNLLKANTLDEVKQAALTVSRNIEWLHPGKDANGRICSHLVRNICLIRGLRKLGLQTFVSTPFDPFKTTYQSKEEALVTLHQSEQLSKGEISILDLPVPESALTNGEVAYLHKKFPPRRIGAMSGISSWEESTIPIGSATIRLQVEKIERKNGELTSVIFRRLDQGVNTTPVNICKIKVNELSKDNLNAILASGESTQIDFRRVNYIRYEPNARNSSFKGWVSRKAVPRLTIEKQNVTLANIYHHRTIEKPNGNFSGEYIAQDNDHAYVAAVNENVPPNA